MDNTITKHVCMYGGHDCAHICVMSLHVLLMRMRSYIYIYIYIYMGQFPTK